MNKREKAQMAALEEGGAEEGEMEKVIRDGRVAVLYSPGYGAGWFTRDWADHRMLFCPRIVNAIDAGASSEVVAAIAIEEFPSCDMGAAASLDYEWVPAGTAFKIRNYDGEERIEVFEPSGWVTA